MTRGWSTVFREGIMKPALRIRLARYVLLVAAILSSALWMNSCRNDEPAIPPLTGPSGHRLFITMEATPDHLQIVDSGKRPQVSHVSAQLKNQLGQGVPGEHLRMQITDTAGQVVAIGAFSGTATCQGGTEAECTTDSGGFARADYVAPTKDQSPSDNRIYIFVLLTNPNYTFEVTDRHALDLQLGTPNPGSNCGLFGLNPSFTFTPDAPVVGSQVCFDASTSTTTSGGITKIVWDYGDGHGDNTGNILPCHTYNFAGAYNVFLTMTDQDTNKCTTFQTVPVTSGLPPVCGSIIINPGGSVMINTEYTFTSLATDPDSSIKRYSWSFGDGTSSSSSSNSIRHTYKKAGAFTLILTITDTQGNVTTCTQAITVTSSGPTCSFAMLDGAGLPISSGPSPLTVHFDATSSTDDGGFGNLTFAWDFGDSSLGAGSTPTHAFSATCTGPCSESFNVNLTVTDGDGNSSSCSNSVTATLP